MRSNRLGGYKAEPKSRVVKEINSNAGSAELVGRNSGWVGPLEAEIIEVLAVEKIVRFKPVFIVDKIMARNNIPKEKRLSLLKRISDACKRLTERGILRKLAHGLYEIIRDPFELAKLRVHRLSSYAKTDQKRQRNRSILEWGVKERSGGLGFPGGVGSGVGLGVGVGGLVVDNLRFSGFVGGFGPVGGWGLVSLGGVRYGELGVRVGFGGVFSQAISDFGRWFGLLVIYSNRFKDGSNVLRVEWRPRRGLFRFIRSVYGVSGLRRGYVVRVGLAVVALLKVFDFLASWEEKLWLARLLGGLGLGWLGLGRL